MRGLSLLALGLAGFVLAAPPARTAPASGSKGTEAQPATMSNGIKTQRFNDGVLKTDRTGKGAVLCIWGIYEAVKVVGRECYQGKDAAFKAELNRSLERIDEFIIKNSPDHVTKADLAARRTQGLAGLRVPQDVCAGDPIKMYEAIRDRGPVALEAATTDLLSIPREAVMNPCI